MKAQAEKTVAKQSKAVAAASPARQFKEESEGQFEDRRPEAVGQRCLAGKADSSPQAGGIAQLQAMVDGSADATIQRLGLDEEEPLQGKFETVQKQPEEEELLQGKFETTQKQGLEEEELLQGKFEAIQKQGSEEEEIQIQARNVTVQKKDEKSANKTGLPDTLKSGIESLSGLSLDDVRVHYNSPKPTQLQAHAFAQGADIHLAPGQEKHLPHEAWHVVQQKQRRVKPTKQLKGKVNVNDDAGLEKEADVMGAKALSTSAQAADPANASYRPLRSDPMQGGCTQDGTMQRIRKKRFTEAPEEYAAIIAKFGTLVDKGKEYYARMIQRLNAHDEPDKDTSAKFAARYATTHKEETLDPNWKIADSAEHYKTKEKDTDQIAYKNYMLPDKDKGHIVASDNHAAQDVTAEERAEYDAAVAKAKRDGTKSPVGGPGKLPNTEILWNQYEDAAREAGFEPGGLTTITRAGLASNALPVIDMCDMTLSERRGGKLFPAGTDEYYALLTTDNVKGSTFMVADHKKALKYKIITGITASKLSLVIHLGND